jgi:hypothetical protein
MKDKDLFSVFSFCWDEYFNIGLPFLKDLYHLIHISILLFSTYLEIGLQNYLYRVALNHDPPDLSLQSS